MPKLLALSLWLLTFTAALFVLATDVWQGAPLWYFAGAVLLGVLEPLGTWIIVKRYPETDWLAWLCMSLMGSSVGLAALWRLQ
jgi:hypothetical protein